MTDKYCGNCKYCGEVLKDNLEKLLKMIYDGRFKTEVELQESEE